MDRLCVWLSADPADRVRALADQGQGDEAEALLTALLKQPDQPQTLLLAGRFLRQHADCLRFKGEKARADGAERQARAAHEKLLHLQPDHAGYAAEFAEFLLSRPRHWEVLEPVTTASAGGTTLTPQPDGSILASGKNPWPETYTVTARTTLKGITAFRLEVLPDPSLPRNGPGRSVNEGNLLLNELRITAAPEGSPSRAERVVLDSAWADYSQYGFPVGHAIDGKPDTGWALGGELGQAHVALFTAKEPLGNTADTLLTFDLEQRLGDGTKDYNIGRFRLSVTNQPQALRDERWRAIALRGNARSWTSLSAAHCLHGEWPAALAVLDRVTTSPSGSNGYDGLLLALIHAQLGQRQEARRASNRFLAWMGKNGDETDWQLAAEHLPDWLAQPPQPDSVEVRLGRAWAFLFLNQPDRARAEVSRAAQLDTDDPELLDRRANLSACCGLWASAADDFARLTTLTPAPAHRPWQPWYRRALALLVAGKKEEYRKACTAMLEHFRDAREVETAFFTVWSCALGPDAVPDFAPALELANRAVVLSDKDARAHQAVGAIHYRAGRLEESVKRLHAALSAPHHQGLISPAYLHYFLAMAHHRLGQQEQARQALATAVARTDREINAGAGNFDLERWVRKQTLELLRAEAEALLGETATRPEK
jgi:tetratricopeptide (TPR) repeat protein